MTQPNSPADPPSTGFILVEQVLHEYRDCGRSPTLEAYKARMEQGLGKITDASAKSVKEAQAVRAAFGLATELIETMRAEARKPRLVQK